MINVRALAEQDLGQTLEGEFGIPVILIDPEGHRIDKTADGRPLVGRVLWSQPRTNLTTGEIAIVPDPVVVLRRSSLARVPIAGERWAVIIPTGPIPGSAIETYLLDTDTRVPESGRNLGTVKLPLVKASQAEVVP